MRVRDDAVARPKANMATAHPGALTGRKEVFLLLLGFAALVAVGASSIWLAQRNAAFSDQIAQTLELRAEVRRMLVLAQNAETGQRGYLLTEDAAYLAPYESALADRAKRTERLLALAGPAGSVQRERADALLKAVDAKLEELAETVALQRQGRRDEALALVKTDRGREAMIAVRRIAEEMVAHEDAQFAERSAASNLSARWQLAVVLLGLLLAAGLAYGAQFLVRRQAREITAAQAELKAANEGLEAAVLERTSELVSANQEIQRFAYIVSHDLRAPLVNVMGFTSELDAARKQLKEQFDAIAESAPELLSPDARLAVEEDLPEAIGFIRTSTSKMDRLINAILKLSREGRRVVTPETISVADMVTAIASTMHQQTAAADAEIVAAPGLPVLVSDRLAFEQIMQNLIENAVKYLDRSRPGRIVVSGRRRGAFVDFSIEDNGRGIDAKDHERVFELFRRAGAQDQPGEGLGLAFVRATVRRLGGAIRLDSEPGRGSTFHLTFPAVYRPQSESQPA